MLTRREVTTMRWLLAVALTGTALAVAVWVAQAQTDEHWCPPYAYYNTALGQCVTHPPSGGGGR
jgi:hypothetical protein